MTRREHLSKTKVNKKQNNASAGAAHTPGPWVVWQDYSSETFVVANPPDEGQPFRGQLIASRTNCPDWTANARLIAAAPDLLAQLQHALAFIEHAHLGDTPPSECDSIECGIDEGPTMECDLKAIRAAIARAEGRAE